MNQVTLDTKAFERLLIDIEKLGGNVQKVTETALRKAASQIQADTVLATANPKLPAQGDYALGLTTESIIHWPRVEWDGQTAWIPVGFDFSKPGAAGYLIKGTPRMAPAQELRKMYFRINSGNRYMSEISKEMQNFVWDELTKLWDGNK